MTEQNHPSDSPGTVSQELAGGPEEAVPDQNEPAGGPELAPPAAAEPASAALEQRQPRHYDWPAIRRRYVEGVIDREGGVTDWPTLDACAEHFGVAANRVRERSAEEGWRAQRSAWQAQLEATRRQAKLAAMSKEATQIDGAALQTAKVGLGLVQHRLQQIAAQRDVVPVDAQEQQRLAQAADLWHKVGLRAVGDPETHRIELTGAGGAPIEIAAELRRDDPSRMAGVLGVLAQAGLGDLFGGNRPGEVVDGEVVPEREAAR